MATRTITLTNRPPVKINEDNWPKIASASDSEHDNQCEFQANRKSKWWINVRQHDDGRAIVYGGYEYDTALADERNLSARRGVLLPAGSDSAAIVAAIRDVTDNISVAEHNDDDAQRWPTLAADCIADLPAETLE